MSAANGGGGSGQAPASEPQTSGQAPQANNHGSGTPQSANAGQQPQAGSGNSSSGSSDHATGQQNQQLSQADYERIIADLRRENADHRTKHAATAAELKKLQDAGLSAEEKRERDYSEMQAQNLEYELRIQQQSLQLAGYRLGGTLGIGDVGAALALVQSEHGHEIKYAADGTPENIEALLKKVLQEHPILNAQTSGGQPNQQRPGGNNGSGGPTNPGGQARPGTFTREQIAKMTPQEYVQHRDAIFEALKAGQIRQ